MNSILVTADPNKQPARPSDSVSQSYVATEGIPRNASFSEFIGLLSEPNPTFVNSVK